jgi:hypothetical protein
MGDSNVEILAALIEGDRWLSSDSCAAYLGLWHKDGTANRRRFLERIACLPDFPAPNPITRTWKKSEVDRWATNQARLNRAA